MCRFIIPCLYAIAGCTTTPAHQNTTMRITFLGSPTCPNTPRLRANLQLAVDELGIKTGFEDINQDRLPDGDMLRRYPTPTILLNGRDLYGLEPSENAGAGCRIYRGGLPQPDDLARLLKVQINAPAQKVPT